MNDLVTTDIRSMPAQVRPVSKEAMSSFYRSSGLEYSGPPPAQPASSTKLQQHTSDITDILLREKLRSTANEHTEHTDILLRKKRTSPANEVVRIHGRGVGKGGKGAGGTGVKPADISPDWDDEPVEGATAEIGVDTYVSK